MPKFTFKLVAALALAGVSLGEISSASAQDAEAGEVTITDSKPEPITETESLPTPGDAGGTIAGSPTMDAGVYAGNYTGYNAGGNLYVARTNNESRWYGFSNQGPWQRPIHRPIYRIPVQYARYWPTPYYTGGYDPSLQYAQALPMVYQPTDTTQLGFYYQRVPQWQPRPNAIPAAPWPPNWHYTVVSRAGMPSGSWGYSAGSYVDGSYGYGDSSTTMPADSQSVTPPAVIHPNAGQPTPAIPMEVKPMNNIPLAPAPDDIK